MDIVAALFIEGIDMRQAPGPSTRIDLTGIHFSAAAPSPPPVTVTPHLVVIVRCAPGERGMGALEVVFELDGEPLARNVSPVQIEPGKFSRQLVQPELTFPDYGTVEARCRIDLGPVTTVPYTLLPPVG
jgi:hypothetical protein